MPKIILKRYTFLTRPTCRCTCRSTDLGLSDCLLDVIVSELVSNGVTNADAVTLNEQVVVDHCLDVAIETPGHFVVKLHGDDVHEGAGLVPESVLGKNATQKLTVFNNHLCRSCEQHVTNRWRGREG